ncbi:hypothetical protein FB45DRAFT_840336 [Roridomyces roridus]|uniref:Uncharacterized protein n=1 Tax=Roridomyces roridus TaxID=1738132 RepID=A0AAD7FE29_9AGAR|nr:hypothetical protein FB45DRAFT_840336 [Roridomyces roridus]
MATTASPAYLHPISNGSSVHPGAGSPSRSSASYSPTRVAQVVSDLSSTANNLVQASTSSVAGTSNANPNAFRAPAHKHAHHLHSIPPREKSTRTLIIDHMLWVHGRTRFAQARAELGMTDRTGGPGTPQYAHRHRPENYEEEDDVGSDGEDAVTLKARAGDPGRPHNDDEDERLRSQDLVLARSLRLRAEGLEKVVTSMLDQPPAPHRVLDEDVLTPPTSPRIAPASTHALPNGVRLRLALGTMINDLFARQAPVPPERHRRTSSATSHPPARNSNTSAPVPPLPPSLAALATVSGSCPDRPEVQPWTRPSSSMRPGPGPMYPVQPRSPPVPSARTRALYDAGADPSTANSPPAFRCPRHLHTGCEICVEAKTSRPGSNGVRGRAPSIGGGDGGAGRTQYWKAMPGGVSPEGGGITGWQDGSGIGSGLSRPAQMGTVLRRRMQGHGTEGSVEGPSTGVGNTKLTELIGRFMRLSAMVAAEMGREARGEEEEPASPAEDKDADEDSSTSPESTERAGWEPPSDLEPLPPPATPLAQDTNPYENQTPMYGSALRPSREWYLLLAGLLTRAVLEGYLTGGWRGPDAVDCLLKVGLGMQTPAGSSKDPEAFGEFDPDELPSLLDAARMLFPALRYGTAVPKGLAEEEFEMEMETRLRRFYDIPPSTPDLSTHMEDLAWQYPAEPVERAAVRFCEAIEKWRGKPELETYKKKTSSVMDTPSSTLSMGMHGSPATSSAPGTGTIASSVTGSMVAPYVPRSTRKPSIAVYFPQPFPNRRSWNGRNRNKRMREPEGDAGAGEEEPAAKIPRNGEA